MKKQQPQTTLKPSDTLEVYYERNNHRLPVDPIPDEIKECKDNKALKVFK